MFRITAPLVLTLLCSVSPLFAQTETPPANPDSSSADTAATVNKPSKTTALQAAHAADLAMLDMYQKERHNDARDKARKALHNYQLALGEEHEDVATAWENLSGMNTRLRDYPTAIEQQQQALSIRKNLFGRQDLLTAKSMTRLAFLYTRIDSLADADELYHQALEILVKRWGKAHPNVYPYAGHLRNLAVLYELRGYLKRARQLYEEVLDLLEEHLGTPGPSYDEDGNRLLQAVRTEERQPLPEAKTDLPDLIRDLRALAQVYEKKRRLDDADALYAQAVERFETILSVDDPEVWRAAENRREVGKLYLANGQLHKAARLFKLSHGIFVRSLGKTHPRLARFGDDYHQLAAACLVKDSLDFAVSNLDLSAAIIGRTRGEKHRSLLVVGQDYRQIGQLYLARNRLGTAERQLNNARSILSGVLGNQHSDLIPLFQDYRRLAVAYIRAGNAYSSLELLDLAWKQLSRIQGENHPDMLKIASDYRSYSEQFRPEGPEVWGNCEQSLRSAVEIYEKADGEQHNNILGTLNELQVIGDNWLREDYTQNALEVYAFVLEKKRNLLPAADASLAQLMAQVQQLESGDLTRFFSARAGTASLLTAEDAGYNVLSSNSDVQPPYIQLKRYPTMRTPEIAVPGSTIAVQVSLTEEQITPEVFIEEGETTSDGQLVLNLPEADRWEIDVLLSAPGLRIRDNANIKKIVLPRDGDSTPADFEVLIPGAECAPSQATLYVTLWYKGSFLGKISRVLHIAAEANAATPPGLITAPLPGRSADDDGINPGEFSQGQQINMDVSVKPADLTLWILKDIENDNAGKYEIQINSPYIQPYCGSFTVLPQTAGWIASQSQGLTRGAEVVSIDGTPAPTSPARTIDKFQGFGRTLYKNVAPPELRQIIADLLEKRGDKFQSIQIYTNNPGIPWELMHTDKPMKSFDKPGFLGMRFQIARWHISSNQNLLLRPPQTLPMRRLAMIAPRYEGRLTLPSQQKELAELQRIQGFSMIEGRYESVRNLFSAYPPGIIHFAGHGEVRETGGLVEYSILLEDDRLDLVSWRGMAGPASENHPFIFFNACEVGQSYNSANFVDGWAPAVLESGASGYVSGLWPIGDNAAADFAVQFYRSLGSGLQQGQVNVADLIRQARGKFLETGDPTYLAYVYYGDPNFVFYK